MKLYIVKGWVEDKEEVLGFVGTQVHANKSLKALDVDVDSPYWEPIEVPTKKEDLLEWLNEWVRESTLQTIKGVVK